MQKVALVSLSPQSNHAIVARFRIRQSDSEDRSREAGDDTVRRPRHPPHVPLHAEHGQHPRRQLQVRLRQVVQVRDIKRCENILMER